MISDHHHSRYSAVDTGWIYARNEQVTLNEIIERKDKGYRNEKPLLHPRMHYTPAALPVASQQKGICLL